MKVGTIRHPKVYALAKALGVPRGEAVGILSGFWENAAVLIPSGDISLAPPESIAEESMWHGEAQVLIDALVSKSCRLVDKLPGGILYIHDWHEHCENTVHKKLWRRKAWFANGMPPKFAALDGKDKAAAEQWYSTHKPPESRRNPAGIPPESLPIPIPIPIPVIETTPPTPANDAGAGDVVTTKPKPRRKKPNVQPPAPDADFEQFWEAYPNKTGKKAARVAWDKAKDRPPIDDILIVIDLWKKTERWTKDNGQYIKNPARWLNQGCWSDEPVMPPNIFEPREPTEAELDLVFPNRIKSPK